MILVPQSELDRLHEVEKENAYLRRRLNLVTSMSEAWRKSSANQQAINVANMNEVNIVMEELRLWKEKQQTGGLG